MDARDQCWSTAPATDVLDSIDEPLFAVDGDGRVVFVNEPAAALLGRDGASLVGESAWGVLRERFDASAPDALERAMADGADVSFETYAEPREAWFRVRAFPFRDGLTVRLNEAPEQPVDGLSDAVDAADDGIAVLDDGQFVYVNRAYADTFGFAADELLGSDWRRLYEGDAVERLEETVLPAIERDGQWRGVAVGTKRDGSSVEHEVTLSRVEGDRLVCTSRDVTERKRRERQLERQRTRLRVLFDNSPDGIVIHDAEGAVLDANQTECDTLGIDRETLLSMNVAEFEVGYDREELQAMWAEMAEGDVLKVEGEHRRGDGEVFPVEIWVNKVTVNGTEQFIAVDREVTERVARERELERSREFIETAQESASIGGWGVEFPSESLRWTDEVYRIHGLTPDADVTLADAIEFYHPDDRETITDAFERLRTDGEPYDVQLRIRTQASETRWVRAVAEPQFDDDGAVTGAIGIFQDITDRKASERELRETKERLDLAVEGANLGIWDWDVETDGVAFNDRWATMLGLSPDEVDPHLDTWEERVHPDDMERVEAALTPHMEGETELYDCEHRMRTTDGDWKWIRDAGKVVERDEDGTPLRAVGIHLDIDERKEYEKTLEQTREELRQIIDLVPDLLFAKDENGVYLLANETTAEAYGMEPDAVEGKTERDILPDADESTDFQEDDRRVMESGEPLEIPEEELTTADGETRLFRTTKIPYTVAGRDETAVLGYARDITDLKTYERQLETQRDNLNILNQIVRHDIRNSLNIVVGYAEFLEDHVDDDGVEYLEPVVNAAREAIDITTSAREVTELLLQAETDLSRTNLQRVLQHRIDDVQSSDRSVLVTTDGSLSDTPVLADDMLGSVFRNLLQNAILHNDADVPEIRLSTTEFEDCVRVSIADNGGGIPDDRKDVIFDEGARGIDSDGTGLGLYLVRTLVNRYDGAVWVEDNENGGATFVVELPRADSATSA
ncbi:PAS domain S-box protein [Halobacterium jilantaiense]|uniref:histidine kinase n=1 Tax=Halobacterium jilantaiense TaxID=355548 RepID=A0A1I0QDT1_9EURY|nr:PAS domain S-box protein [Halobacterium jilantaiense]SEW25219.1 PAS domain S-box-containing protein [Halobacterium jilantaiense]